VLGSDLLGEVGRHVLLSLPHSGSELVWYANGVEHEGESELSAIVRAALTTNTVFPGWKKKSRSPRKFWLPVDSLTPPYSESPLSRRSDDLARDWKSFQACKRIFFDVYVSVVRVADQGMPSGA